MRRPRASIERATSEKVLRSAARDRVADTSLRKVAREIGMSPPGLSLFLDGGSLRSETLAKVRAWHVKDTGANVPSVETARTALDLLVAHLVLRDRAPTMRLILDVVAHLHRRKGSEGPPWLAHLCAEFGDGEAS